MTVFTFTATNVVAPLGVDVAPGIYALTLVNNTLAGGVDKRSATFPVTLGAVGPQGSRTVRTRGAQRYFHYVHYFFDVRDDFERADQNIGNGPGLDFGCASGHAPGHPRDPLDCGNGYTGSGDRDHARHRHHSESAVFSPRGWAVLEPGVLDPLPNCDCWLVN